MPPKLDLDIPALARHIATKGPHKTLSTPRRIRILLGGHYIADTTSALFVWEHPYYPQYYLPRSAFRPEHIEAGPDIDLDGRKIANRVRLRGGDRGTGDGVAFDDALDGAGEAVAGMVRVVFESVDTWLEEDTPIYVHPKDPFKRIDIVASSRPVRVALAGTTLAFATASHHLYETGLPTRYYMPLTAVDQTVLRPSSTRTRCPYKGEAEYYSVVVDGVEIRDVVWYYTRPTVECAAIQGLVCFYSEKVEVEVGGVKEEEEEEEEEKPGGSTVS